MFLNILNNCSMCSDISQAKQSPWHRNNFLLLLNTLNSDILGSPGMYFIPVIITSKSCGRIFWGEGIAAATVLGDQRQNQSTQELNSVVQN